MAAYGALLSLMNTIHQIQNHPRPPISLDTLQIERLIENVAFLQDFLESYIIDDADGLEGRIADAAHEAEDIVESYIADHIEARGKANISSNSGSLDRYMKKKIQKMTLHVNNNGLYRKLQKVIHDLRSITKDVAAIKDKAGKNIAPSNDAMVGSGDVMNNIMDKLSVSYSEGDDTMVGVMNKIMDKLTNQQSDRWIIAIAGMGGIGKTTLAKRIYEHPLIVEHFDISGWATVSQEFDSKRILLQVLHCLKKTMGSEDSEYEELGQNLYQSLFGRRYLIVMDDIWGTNAWDMVKRFFPDNKDGSKVLITTRLSNVALQLDGPDYFQMPFLKVDESWNLLRRCVFQEQGCPSELEEIGKDIATNCGGLPLSIVVIGGLLAKSERTRENWQHVLENLSSIVNLEEGEHCFRILKLSYNQLPVHLKPCFLYIGMFPEDHEIHVPTLLKLWVSEGFVKPVAGKSLETVAREVYLHGLVIRNLILVRAWGCTRRIKLCGIHDLLRDLCIKEAEKYKFFFVKTQNLTNHVHDKSWRNQRRIGVHEAGSKWYDIPPPLPKDVQSASRARTLILEVNGCIPSIASFRLLRVLKGLDKSYFSYREYPGQDLLLPVNLCHLAAARETELPVEVFYRLWNLRTLILDKYSSYDIRGSVLDIWRMPQLRQVKVFDLLLTDPPPFPPMDEENGDRMVLENLETLKTVHNLRLGEEVVERIPNIKKLGISGGYGLDNLCRLRKLEGLSISFSLLLSRPVEVRSFPVSLRKLTLEGTMLGCEEMRRKIGSLPYLEVLKLHEIAFLGPEWETAEGGFPSLKYMEINGCPDLEQWRAEATHFPCLERLDLSYLHNLQEIPSGIGDIPTLREINVVGCPDSAVLSAKKILEEQEECYGEVELQIRVSLPFDTQLRKESLRSRNLHFSDYPTY